LPEPVDLTHAHALRPGNDSERLLFRNLSPNLVRLDCQGVLRPGLLEAWSDGSNGTLTVTLREKARLGSGRRISVADVLGTLAPAAGAKVPGIDSAVALNDREVRIFSTGSTDSVLRTLADPAFAVLESLATGSTSISQGSIDIPARDTLPVLQLRFPLSGDARDALDRGADLIVSRDPALLEYAGRRPEFTVHPLPWNRTYVLVQPASAQLIMAVTTKQERQSLAQDAVHADARGAEPPFWWMETSCPPAQVPAVRPTSDRVVYLRDDGVARALAERLVALAGPANRLRTDGLDESQMTSALRAGSERAYVVSILKHPLQPCGELRAFPAGARIRPLIDSRAHAIVRHGAPPLSIEWDGTIRVETP
jgi:hypothetical protein